MGLLVVPGADSEPWPTIGGEEIGRVVVETLSGFYLPEGFKDIAAYIVLLAVLLLRPQGLFGGLELGFLKPPKWPRRQKSVTTEH